MSIEALNWAFNLPLKKPTQKAVLVALANHADPYGGNCYPSIPRIQLYTGLSNKPIANAIKALEAAGLVSAIRSKGKKTKYQLNLEVVYEVHGLKNDTSVRGTPLPVYEVHDTRVLGTHKPSLTTNITININAQFDDFWSAYPRKVGKRKALLEFERAIKRCEFEQIMAGLSRQVQAWQEANTETKYIPHPTTWLHRDGWYDEAVKPRNGSRLKDTTAKLLEMGAPK